jgi:transcriptional regulator with XRE-family HTH domain
MAKKPVNMAYPTSLNTLGDHLRKVRLDRKLSQPELAKLFKVNPDTITGWELNRHQPPMRLAKKIVAFLGYLPFQDKGCPIGKQLYLARLVLGHTQEQAARKMKCDESNIRYIELEKRTPKPKTYSLIQEYVALARSQIMIMQR